MPAWLRDLAPAIDDFRAHAAASWPRECVGAIAGGRYVPLENLSADADEVRFDSAAALAFGPELEAILHSHVWRPDRSWCELLIPSEMDLRAQRAWAIPWGLAAVRPGVVSEVVWWGL